MQGTLGDYISYVEKPRILELWYKKRNNEETSCQGNLYNTRQVKVIKLRLKIVDYGGNGEEARDTPSVEVADIVIKVFISIELLLLWPL